MPNNTQKWELNDIPQWPIFAQYIVFVLLAAMIAAASYYFILAPLQYDISEAEAQTLSLEEQVTAKYRRILREGTLEEQKARIKEAQVLLAQHIPDKDEFADLLEEISNIGEKNNLLFKKLNWADGKVYDWLYQQTLQIDLQGNFYGIGYFCAQIAQLNRLIALQDFVLEKVKSNQASKRPDPLNDKLRLVITAHTYRAPKPSEMSKPKVKK
ncbi:MAG: type 4a pilus biogenesis protein PilO [Vibrionaceae bacterium]